MEDGGRRRERKVSVSKKERSANHGNDIGIVLFVSGYNGTNNLYFVEETFREQWTNWTIDQARGQGFFFRRTAFTLQITARDTASGIAFFLVMYRQREEILAW